ncbi:DUF7146 domain-containing protein [Halioxenophilus aromaticivorans]|jgi:hypothetical protein|uniref:Toprim domain-containing protein n=1 Tax=Halioxenophilus aromaticivorans TaxID=1306992 RepID=A0AAV3U3L7_9ALTE|tara:strand:- start:5434 stop:6564 length:1131 start_codon:yes stop_codon:yes gene_type:complete
MGYKRNSSLLKERMRGKWLAAFSALAGQQLAPAMSKLGENVTCPIDGDIEGFRLFKDANETGGGVKQNRLSDGVYPDGITLLMEVLGRPFTEVFDNLVDWLDGPGKRSDNALYDADIRSMPATERRQTKKTVDNESDMREWLNNLWRHSVRLDDSKAVVARTYLEGRHIVDAALSSKDLRFNPALTFKDSDGNFVGKYPGLMALVRDNDGVPVALHRTFLTKTGDKLRLDDHTPARKQTPAVSNSKGRVVCLAPPVNGVLGLAEGIETSLSVMQATKVPVWSCLSAAMMSQFVPPNGVHTLMIFVDVDRNGAGQKAATGLAEKLASRGIRVIPMVPLLKRDVSQKSIDWADQLDADLQHGTHGMAVVTTAFNNAII